MARDVLPVAAQYGLLGGFAAVAAGISAQGLIGFARDNMGLRWPWPYLLFFALDGAAGVCAVLLMRRAARAETAIAPRLAVWGLVAASAVFNWTHAPHHPAARQAFALMPVIAATLFEFSLRETARETRRTHGHPDRRLPPLAWLRPAERIRVQLQFAGDPALPAEAAVRRVRADLAAKRLYQLRQALHAASPSSAATRRTRRTRRAERKACAALTRARFADPDIAALVLRQVQVLTITPALASLDYVTAEAAHTAIGNLIAASPAVPPVPPQTTRQIPNGSRKLAHSPADLAAGVSQNSRKEVSRLNGHSVTDANPGPGRRRDRGDQELIEAAARIVAHASRDGVRLSQTALANELRARGHSIANDRLSWLSIVSGLRSGSGIGMTIPAAKPCPRR